MAASLIALEDALRDLAPRLDASGHRWALVGGLAVSARAEPRTTRDLDVSVAVGDDREAEVLIQELQAGGPYRVRAVVEQRARGRLATVRLERPSAVVVDLLFASSGIEREVAHGAELIEILPGLVLPVARVGHLMALKVLARDDRYRPQDLDDLRALLEVASPDDLDQAREALSLIEARGFQRNRRLVDLFDAFLRDPDGESPDR